MRIISNYDIINEGYKGEENILFLLPDLIEDELLKIEKKSPISVLEKDGEKQVFLFPSVALEGDKTTRVLRYYIPEGTIMPIGGPDGKFYLKTLGTCVDERFGLTEDIGYQVVERKSGQVLFSGKDLRYFGKNLAALDEFLIVKNTIIHHTEPYVVFEKTGQLMLDYEKDREKLQHVYVVYNADGGVAAVDTIYKECVDIGKDAPEFCIPEFVRDRDVFEKMVIASIKDRKGLEDCEADDLIGITNYLSSKNMNLAVDLDSLEVYKVNYKKYFNRKKREQEIEKNETFPKVNVKNQTN